MLEEDSYLFEAFPIGYRVHKHDSEAQIDVHLHTNRRKLLVKMYLREPKQFF